MAGKRTASSLTLVNINSVDGLTHYGQSITWKVTTTATSQPFVTVQCTQNGIVVYTAHTGYFDGYSWPWTQTMILSSGAWTSGAAEGTARLYSASSTGRTTTLATANFHVYE